jgi:hypothetical protein
MCQSGHLRIIPCYFRHLPPNHAAEDLVIAKVHGHSMCDWHTQNAHRRTLSENVGKASDRYRKTQLRPGDTLPAINRIHTPCENEVFDWCYAHRISQSISVIERSASIVIGNITAGWWGRLCGNVYDRKVKWCKRTISFQAAKNSCTSDCKAEQDLGSNTVYRVCPYRGNETGLFCCSA